MPRYPTTEMCDGALLEAFEPTVRDSDVFCATAPKSGQTWLMALMYHLKTRGLDPDMGGKHAFAHMPWLELPFDIIGGGKRYELATRLAEFEALSDPRLFKMHVIYEEIPRPTHSRSRVVTITRDLRDLPYSMYSHMLGMNRLTPEQESFDVYFERWMELGYAFQVARSMWPHRNEPHVLWLRYEDLKADLRREAEKLCAFLQWNVSEAELDRVLPLVSLGRMQENENKLRDKPEVASMWRPGARFFREGAVGKNRARLSPQQEASVVERARRELEPECFDFVMQLG
jgi:hypothetical protein